MRCVAGEMTIILIYKYGFLSDSLSHAEKHIES